jgi:Putative MetA-pathway of phenol degradation
MRILWGSLFLAALFGIVISSGTATAQDLEPRAYAASPIGANFIVAGGGRSSGAVLLDPSLPITDAHAIVNAPLIGGGSTFDLFGRTALLVAAVPYALASATGNVGEQSASITRSGLADPRVKLSVNFVGGRAMTVSEFAKSTHPTIVGASVTAVVPLGQYDPHKLINIGSNRWSFKPEAGVSHRVGQWTIEEYAGAWLFTSNHGFFPGSSVRTQNPVFTFQAHVSYTFKQNLWAAFDWTFYAGGTTAVDHIETGGLHRNTRGGVTFSLPLVPRQSLKFAISKGVTTRIGADFTTISVAWQLSWFSRQPAPANPPVHP